MTVDDLRRKLEDLPGETPVLLFSFKGDLVPPLLSVEDGEGLVEVRGTEEIAHERALIIS